MRPGQIEPNDLELAILERLKRQENSIRNPGRQLHVLSRKFTGVGSYTTFNVAKSSVDTPKRHVVLEAVIAVPGVEHGLGAVLWLKGDDPECLEVFSYAAELWDGVHEEFSVGPKG